MQAGVAAVLLLVACSPPDQAAPAATPATPTVVAATTASPAPDTTASAKSAKTDFAALEDRYDARLGVYALDTGSGRSVGYRSGERFAFASTMKALAAAAVLKRTPASALDRVVSYEKSDLVTYSPVTEKHAGEGMTLRALCDAAIRYSDNTAGNLLVRQLGGPAGLDRDLENVGDQTSNVVRVETALNEAAPGDPRDTSTPEVLAANLRNYAVGDALTTDDRALLTTWLRGNTTGDKLIRAGLPASWEVGDKTGAGGYGTRNDIAITWPPDRPPIILAVMSSREKRDAKYDDALIADATRRAVEQLGS